MDEKEVAFLVATMVKLGHPKATAFNCRATGDGDYTITRDAAMQLKRALRAEGFERVQNAEATWFTPPPAAPAGTYSIYFEPSENGFEIYYVI